MRTLDEKIALYYENTDLFIQVFGEEGEQYWKIFLLHSKDGVSFEKLSAIFPYSAMQIRRIWKRVDTFLDAEEMPCHLGYLDKELPDDVVMPDIFLPWNRTKVSLNAEKIFCVAVYMLENELETNISREFIIQLGVQYRNKERRMKLIKELNSMEALIDSEYSFKIFDDVQDVKGSLVFQFSLLASIAIISAKFASEQNDKGIAQ